MRCHISILLKNVLDQVQISLRQIVIRIISVYLILIQPRENLFTIALYVLFNFVFFYALFTYYVWSGLLVTLTI